MVCRLEITMLIICELGAGKGCLTLKKLDLICRKGWIFEFGEISNPRKSCLWVLFSIPILLLCALILRHIFWHVMRCYHLFFIYSFFIFLKSNVKLAIFDGIFLLWCHIYWRLRKTCQTVLNYASLTKISFCQGRFWLVNLQQRRSLNLFWSGSSLFQSRLIVPVI